MKKRNSTLAIVATLLSIAALVIFLVMPMFGADTGVYLLLEHVGDLDASKWAKGVMILSYIFVALLALDIVLCVIRGVNGKFFKTLSRSGTFAIGVLGMITYAMYIINMFIYDNKPLLHFVNPFASADGHVCHHITIFYYVVSILILARIIVQMFAGGRDAYYKQIYAHVEDVVEVEYNDECECEEVVEECECSAEEKPVCENLPACESECECEVASVVTPAPRRPMEKNEDLRGRGRSNARAIARDRDVVVSYVDETAIFDSSDIQPAKELTLPEKIEVLIQEREYHKPMTEEEIMLYVTSKCEVETKENPLSQSRYVMYKDKAMGFFHTLKDGSVEIVARVEEDFAREITSQLDEATYSVVPKSPKWIKIPSSTPGNIVKAIIDSSLAETGIVADESKAQESQYKKRLRDAKKKGIADVKSISESFKGVEDVEVKKADKRNYISIKKDGKTLAFVNGKDIDFKLTVKADESRLAYYENSGISVTKATFPTTPGWYTIESEGDISLDMIKTILNDAYKAN